MDTKNFKFSPWHIYTCVFVGFWICSACFNSFLSTLVLCILFGLISDHLNKFMVGENNEDKASHASNPVVKEENVENHCAIKESHEVVEEPSTFVDRNLVEENLIETQQYESNSEPFAPTKPLPPEPEDMANESEEEENKMETQSTSSESSSNSDAKNSEKQSRKSSNADKELEADLLEPLDEYDKHPIPESVEFVNSNKDYQEEEEVLCNNDTSPCVQEIQEEASNNEDNTSPSQDSSFQMLDIGSDSDIGKGLQDEILSESKNVDSLTELDDTIIDSKDNDDSIDTEKNEAIEPTVVPSVVQFSENSNVDSQEHLGQPLAEMSSEMNNDKIRQTSKEFVDELMEEALNITSEHKIETECLSLQTQVFDEDVKGEENEEEDDDKSSNRSSPQTSPRDLMEDLLESVQPPSTSPPQDRSDEVTNDITENKQGVDQDQFIVEGEIKINDNEPNDNNELERLLSDAQKDEPVTQDDDNVTDIGDVLKGKNEPLEHEEVNFSEDIKAEIAQNISSENVVIDDLKANESDDILHTSQELTKEVNEDSNMEVVEEKFVAEEVKQVDSETGQIKEEEPIVGIFEGSKERKDSSSDYDEEDKANKGEVEEKIYEEQSKPVEIEAIQTKEEEPIVGIFGGSKDRKDSSSDYDDDEGKDEDAVEGKVGEDVQIKRTISSDYEEENENDDKSSGDHEIEDAGEIKRTRNSSSSEYEEENDDVGNLVTTESSTKNKLKKRDSSSDYDEGNDNDAAEEHENSDSDIEEEVDIKTKTLADMDEGDPWSEKEKENEKVSCSEFSEENSPGEILQHFDSDDLPAQDDMSHRAVFGDDDDRNEEDVLLLDENEDETKDRENENRKLSTTVPTMKEENELMGLNDASGDNKNDSSPSIQEKLIDEGKKEENVSSSELISDKSLEPAVESAIEAKECQDISEDIEGLLLQSDVSKVVTETLPDAPLTSKDSNFTSSISEAKEEPLIDF